LRTLFWLVISMYLPRLEWASTQSQWFQTAAMLPKPAKVWPAHFLTMPFKNVWNHWNTPQLPHRDPRLQSFYLDVWTDSILTLYTTIHLHLLDSLYYTFVWFSVLF
jgi:hypothetical protein